MWPIMGTIATVIALLVLLELFALPDWIGRKLRGEIPNKEIDEKIRTLESRVEELEKKLANKGTGPG
jgi:cell division protein ZapA (FtsZ GTPase activity inhibitor)